MPIDPHARAWIEVRSGALRRNYRRMKEAVPASRGVLPMVKADAYGLGMVGAVEALAPESPWGWGVATVDEGVALRGLRPADRIVVFSPVPPGEEGRAVAHGLTLAVSEVGTLDRLREHAGDAPIPVHVEVDTGMGRAGFPASRVGEWGPQLRTRLVPPLRWEGLFTHFHSADEAGGPGVEAQLAAFRQVAGALSPPAAVLLHVANSAAGLRRHPGLRGFGLVRPGIFLYGGRCGPDLPQPEGVAAVRARVIHLREAEPGESVGYGATHRAQGPERWATLAIGYGDGYGRALSNRGQVLLGGRRVPVVGRVSMDMTVVNITGCPRVDPGDTATLLGADGGDEITVDEVAEWMGTIPYEVLTGWTARLPRVWLP